MSLYISNIEGKSKIVVSAFLFCIKLHHFLFNPQVALQQLRNKFKQLIHIILLGIDVLCGLCVSKNQITQTKSTCVQLFDHMSFLLTPGIEHLPDTLD